MTKGPKPRPAIERLLTRVDTSDPEGCWLWPGANIRGYGQIGSDQPKRTVLTHRLAYEHFVGPIPDGLYIDHLCRTRACCNPAHLEPVTNQENKRRAVGHIQVERTHCFRGHPRIPENVFYSPNGSVVCRLCMRPRLRAFKARKRQEKAES